MNTPAEPPRQDSLDLLYPPFKEALTKLLDWMKSQGEDPRPFETLRSAKRQAWLYGIGRKYELDRKPVTWTMQSLHLPGPDGLGRAADIISDSHGWNEPHFFALLKTGAKKFGLQTIPQESCHVQWPR